MPTENAYQRFYEATRLIREQDTETQWIAPASTSHGCSSCGRLWREVEDPDTCGVYQYSSSVAPEYECTACHTVRIKAPEALGIEMYRGKNKVPNGGRLGMLPSCGGVIDPANRLHLALNGGFYRKFQDGDLCRMGRCHEERPFTLLLRLLAEGELAPLAEGLIYVSEWGRKPDRLMGNLCTTRSLSELWCCSEAGAVCIDLEALIATAKWLHTRELGTKATRPAFWKPIREAAQGNMDQEALQKWAGNLPDPQELLDTLPIDPHTRTQLPRLMADIMPWVEGGYL